MARFVCKIQLNSWSTNLIVYTSYFNHKANQKLDYYHRLQEAFGVMFDYIVKLTCIALLGTAKSSMYIVHFVLIPIFRVRFIGALI